jgi:hypothetical protein
MMPPEAAPIAAPLSVCVHAAASGRITLTTRRIFFMVLSYPRLVDRKWARGGETVRSKPAGMKIARTIAESRVSRRLPGAPE